MPIPNISGVSRTNISKINGIQFGNILSINEHYLIPPPVWSMGVSINESRRSHTSCGSFNATLVFCGYFSGPGTMIDETEEFNGTAWSAGGTFAAPAWFSGAAGTQTAALCSGGANAASSNQGRADCLSYNGTAWSSDEGDLSQRRQAHGACGTLSAALVVSGSINNTGWSENLVSTEEYNGTAWSAGGDQPTSHNQFSAVGLQNAAVSLCGYRGYDGGITYTDEIYTYNGTTWTSESSANAGRYSHGASGTQSQAIIFGGVNSIGGVDASEEWNGTNCSVKGDVNSARRQPSDAGGSGYDLNGMYIAGGHETTYAAQDTVEIYGQEE